MASLTGLAWPDRISSDSNSGRLTSRCHTALFLMSFIRSRRTQRWAVSSWNISYHFLYWYFSKIVSDHIIIVHLYIFDQIYCTTISRQMLLLFEWSFRTYLIVPIFQMISIIQLFRRQILTLRHYFSDHLVRPVHEALAAAAANFVFENRLKVNFDLFVFDGGWFIIVGKKMKK